MGKTERAPAEAEEKGGSARHGQEGEEGTGPGQDVAGQDGAVEEIMEREQARISTVGERTEDLSRDYLARHKSVQ
jgi:hypothetical protein